jgi:hypothetical protein
MLPEPDGNDTSGDPLPAPLNDADWDKLRRVLENADSDSRSLKLYTEPPAPESVLVDDTRIGDPSGPQNFTINVARSERGRTSQRLRRLRTQTGAGSSWSFSSRHLFERQEKWWTWQSGMSTTRSVGVASRRETAACCSTAVTPVA